MGLKFDWIKDDRDDKTLFNVKLDPKKPKKKGFVLDWEKSVGWSGNPFKDEILMPVQDFIAGKNEERKNLNLFLIHDNRFGLIRGDIGTGKTILLQWLGYELVNFQKQYVVCYLPAKELKYDAFLKKMVKPFTPALKEIFFKNFSYTTGNVFNLIKEKMPSKNIVFLVDDTEELSKEHFDLLVNLFESMKNIKVFASINPSSEKSVDLSKFGSDDLGIRLKEPDYEELREMIEKRIENFGGIDIKPFSNAQLKALAKKIGNNPREFLSLCNKKAIELSLDKKPFEADIDDEDIEGMEEEISGFKYDNTVNMDDHHVDSDSTFEGDKIVQEILGTEPKKKRKNK